MPAKILYPSSWSISGKLAFAFFFAALVPIFLTAYYGMEETLSRVSVNERQGLTELADVTAIRVEQSLIGVGRTLKLVDQASTKALLAQSSAKRSPAAIAEAQELLVRLVASNEDVQSLRLVDAAGRVVVSNMQDDIGLDVSAQAFFQRSVMAASSNVPIVISFGTASQTDGLGLTLSQPMRDAKNALVGAAVATVKFSTIEAALSSARTRPSLTPFLLDNDGVIAWHPSSALRYKSLMPLRPEAAARVASEGRYGQVTVASLGMADLQRMMGDPAGAVQRSYRSPVSGETEVVAMTALTAAPLIIAVSEPKSRWEVPLREVFASVFGKVLMVTFIAAGVAFMLLSRDVIGPIRQLTRAAEAVKDGKLDVRARVLNDDEVGDLAKTFNGMMDEIVERQHERDVFGRAVSPEVREKLLDGQIELGGENRRVSVLFSDIRSFTTICEGMTPQQVVEMLNEFLTEMTSVVAAYGGHVNNFLGDAIIVVFGAPGDHEDCAWGAVQAAFAMRRRLESLNERQRARGDLEIVSGIGIGTGNVVAGQMGSLERFIYTVVGDVVNVAARLETMTKKFEGNPILVNSETAKAIEGREGVEVTAIGKQALKGKAQEIDVYRVDWALPA
jgi:class 3 adenylate cyclase